MNPSPDTSSVPSKSRPLNTTPERDAAIVRGALIDRLDGALPLVEVAVRQAVAEAAREGPEVFAQRLALLVIQRIQVALFPEEFGGHWEGLMPRAGPPRAGRKRVDGYAKLLLAVAEGG